MTAEAYQWNDTLCRFTNGDFFHTFYQQWALPSGGISCYLVPDKRDVTVSKRPIDGDKVAKDGSSKALELIKRIKTEKP
ncbi:hypothetical protein MTR_0202s0070 [Medicago truncatula]|uniref:Uncharacterized protein n=1 Tax=Medicago truncatula TaxID=3880 RepID=A0A072TGC5_MEDTR|nr:hypothetical protein MTR_0202s0070 [Medicago truncatula]